MISKLTGRLLLASLIALASGALLISGCSSGSAGSATSAVTGPAFIVGTDAPLGAVTSFVATLNSIQATDASGASVELLSSPATIDFARFNGLQTLLSMSNVPVGKYTSVAITLDPSATIGYLDTSGGGAPAIKTMAATLTSTSANVHLSDPLVITQNGAPTGLRIDLSLFKSIQVDSNGQVTGTVNPTFRIESMGEDDARAHIDRLTAAVVSVDTGSQSFVVKGPHGMTFTVNVGAQTQWANGATLSDLTANSIVEIGGKVGPSLTISADHIVILSQDGFYAGGLITYENPASGPASSFDLYVRGLLPSNTGLTLGQIATVDLSGSENFFINWHDNPMTQYLFNQSTLVPGQDVSIGGPASGAADASAVTVKRVVLHHWGFNGIVVPGSVDTSAGTFQMQVTGFAGVLVPQVVTVYITNGTEFRDGWSGLGDLTDSAHVRVVGLLLKDSTSGNLILVGHDVDDLSND